MEHKNRSRGKTHENDIFEKSTPFKGDTHENGLILEDQ